MYYIVLLQYLFLCIYVILLFICIVQPKALYFADLLINLLCFALLIIIMLFCFHSNTVKLYESDIVVGV